MPRDKDFKRHVRHRMGETGERYTQALARLRAAADRPIEWSLSGTQPQSYRLDAEDDETPEGRRTVAVLRSVEDPVGGFGTMSRSAPAAPHRGRRLRFGALVRGQDVSGWAGLWMRVDADDREILALDNMQDRPLAGSFDWTPVSVVLDVPGEGAEIPHGVLLAGEGTIQVAAVRLEPVNESVPTTGRRLPRGGSKDRGRPEAYRVTREAADTPAGRRDVAVVRCVADPGDGFGAVTRGVVAAPHHGGRVRLSALVQGEDVDGWAGLWTRVDGSGRTLAFDNMQDRPLRGTFDWTEASVVLDVAPEAGSIAYGMVLVGRGTVRAADLRLQPAPADTPLTAGRGIPGWMVSGSGSDAYDVRVEPDERGGDRRVLRIGAVADPGDRTIYVGQVVPAEGYRGRPVRLRAEVRADGGGTASLLLALAGAADEELRVERRPLGGPSGWREAEVEVAVPDEAEAIGFGVELAGAGSVRVAGLSLEPVGDGPAVARPRNLDFAEGA